MTSSSSELKAIDPRVEPALKVLIRDGLPTPTGENLAFYVDNAMIRGWQFQTPKGAVFLIPRDEEWFLALDTSTRPAQEQVLSVLSGIGFVLGEALEVEIFRSISASSVGTGMWVLPLAHWGRRTNQQAPTMLTAMVARLVGYSGPIADRAKTYNDITGKDEPAW